LNASQEASLNGPMDETCPIVWGPVPISPYPIFLGNQALTPATGSNGSAAWVPSVGGLVGIRTLLDAKLYWGAGLAESDVCGNPTKEYIYLNGKRIAYQDWTDATGGVYYYFADDLGSASVVTDDQGDVIDESDYYPYGGENMLASGSGQAYKFTGKERDDESGNDYFGARYYSSNMGRWMSPDWDAKPTAVPYADFADPQSLNLYGYVMNNPLSKADKDGHDPSTLTYDGSTHTLTLYSNSGQELGSWHAYNNVDSRASLGKIPNGTYPVIDQKSPYTHGNAVDSHDSNKQDSANGEYGTGGIFRVEPFKGPDGKTHDGVGVHAGREDTPDAAGRKGAEHATNGCVRTCDAAIKKITDTAKTDPLKTVTVQNNRQPTPQPKTGGQ
jgi:RHS repeat-associated protein